MTKDRAHTAVSLTVAIAAGVGSGLILLTATKRITHELQYPFFLLLAVLLAAGVLARLVLSTGRWPVRLAEVSLLLFAVLASLGLAELAARALMKDLPPAIRNKFQFESPFDEKLETIELLSHSPWIKFKPNVCVNRGTPPGPDGFLGEFCTDERGFKNLPGVLARGNVRIVAAGDSFTEGMGLPVGGTWASLLSSRGIPTYSVGVQGYAPEMALGALKNYALDLHPQYVIYGCMACVNGNNAYRDPGTGRIMGNMVNVMREELRVRGRVRYLLAVSAMAHAGTEALIDRFHLPLRMLFVPTDSHFSLKRWLYFLERPVQDDPKQARVAQERLMNAIHIPADAPPIVRRYEREIRSYAANRVPEADFEKAWKSVREDLLEMKKLSENADATFAIIIFPMRGIVYYETFVADFPAESVFSANRRAITRFAKDHQIALIDLTDPVMRYLREIGPDAPLGKFPYFSDDGHMNAVGQSLVAEAVERRVRELGLREGGRRVPSHR